MDKCIVNPERDCLGLMKAQELEKDLNDLRKQNSGSHERIFDRLGELERREGIQGEQYKNILDRLGQLAENLGELKADSREAVSQLPSLTRRVEELEEVAEDVDELKSAPAKKWDGRVEKAIEIVIAAVIGFILARFGL